MKQNLGFANFALASSMKHNRSLKNMENFDKAIDWSQVTDIAKNKFDGWFRQAAYNIARGLKILRVASA